MWQMVERAWSGWIQYTDDGKLAALVLAAIVYLLFTIKWMGPKGRLVIYAGIMTVVCICPVTAVVLMRYQTEFYDYRWIWSIVPVTAVIALGVTLFIAEQCKAGKGGRVFFYNVIVTLASVAVLFLCGGLGTGSVDAAQAKNNRAHAECILAQVRQQCGEEACLWAPADILEYARLDGKRELLYGRNMWDAALNAYSYDTYNEDENELYRWMEHLDDWAIKISVEEVEEYVQRGFAAGAECILLPTEMSDWLPDTESETILLERLKAHEGREVTLLEGYYLLEQK